VIDARRSHRRIITLQHASRSGPENVDAVYKSITDHYCNTSNHSMSSTMLSDQSGRMWTSDVILVLSS
jgi:hypothetical protein